MSKTKAKILTKKIHLHFVTCPGVHHVLFIWERCTAGLEKRSSRKSPPKGGIFYTPTIIVFCAHASQRFVLLLKFYPTLLWEEVIKKITSQGGNIFQPNYRLFLCSCHPMSNAVPQILHLTLMRRGHQENYLPRGNNLHPNYKLFLCSCCQMNNFVLLF